MTEIIILIIFFLALWLLSVMIENWVPTLIILAIAFVVGWIVYLVRSKARAAEEEQRRIEEEKKRTESLLAIVNKRESTPYYPPIASGTDFDNKEEETINTEFRAVLQQEKEKARAKAHARFLKEKIAALKELGRGEEAASLTQEYNEANRSINAAGRYKTYDSPWIQAIYAMPDIQAAYNEFSAKIQDMPVDHLDLYFRNPKVKKLNISRNSALIITPLCFFHYQGTSKPIRTIRYDADIAVSSSITTELREDFGAWDDEIQRTTYLYTKNDGTPDMRYKDNPSFTYVYRGSVTLEVSGLSYSWSFNNKTKALEFERMLKDYIRLMSKYKAIVTQLLDHSDRVKDAQAIEALLIKKEEDSKRRVEQRRIAKEQKERERLEQERIKEAERLEQERIRRREEQERKAREQEEQRQRRFMNSFIVENGVLTRYTGNEVKLEIPEGLVTAIGPAFRRKLGLVSVKIPAGVLTIGDNAFYEAMNLESVQIPPSVQSIGKNAFNGCVGLTTVRLPKGITVIEEGLFSKCASLRNIVIPAGVVEIKDKAFSDCSALEHIVIPKSVTRIGKRVFENCKRLKSIVFSGTLIESGNQLFTGCNALETIDLGGLTVIPNAYLSGLRNLSEAIVSENLVEIGANAFKDCINLQRVHLGQKSQDSSKENRLNSVQRIGKSAFENCFYLSGAITFDSLKNLGAFAFANCQKITAVTFRSAVASVGEETFAGCVSLREVNGVDNIAWRKKQTFVGSPWLASQAQDGFVLSDDWLESYAGRRATVSVPSVRTIGKCAFYGNSYVTDVTLSDGTMEIQALAFAKCRKLKTIHIPDSVNWIADDAFDGCDDLTIRCSRGSAASTFRLKHKIAADYISKTAESTQRSDEITAQPTRKRAERPPSPFEGLSDEEVRVIMQMRREKKTKQQEEMRAAEASKHEPFCVVEPKTDAVSIKLCSDTRTITNTIFNLRFATQANDYSQSQTAYEVFVIDENDRVISEIKTITASTEDSDLIYKVMMSLVGQGDYDKTKAYYVVWRYAGENLNILEKVPYTINIAFASDFDF